MVLLPCYVALLGTKTELKKQKMIEIENECYYNSMSQRVFFFNDNSMSPVERKREVL